jgi:uncharacterized protein (TIGR02611 family)
MRRCRWLSRANASARLHGGQVTGLKHAKRIVVGVIGCTILLIGVALIVLPGPAFLVIPAGLAVLATEFAWARRWLQKVKDLVAKTKAPKKRGSIP